MDDKVKFGDILIARGLITSEQLSEAIKEQKETGKKLGEILTANNLVTEDVLSEVLSEQLNLPVVDLANHEMDYDLARKLPEVYARKHGCLLLGYDADGFVIGMIDPLDIIAYDELHALLKEPIKINIIKAKDLDQHITLIYRHSEEIESYAGQLGDELEQHAVSLEELMPANQIDAPVKKFIHALFEDAIQVGASDIHIEPGEKVLRIRLRVDGVLQEQGLSQKNIAPAVAQCLKLMAKLDMAEKRLPQDGRITLKVKGRVVDVRLSTMPIQHGESVVMRLLNKSGEAVSLESSGMSDKELEVFRRLIHMPNGVILVTGPTGSGKSTTLFGALHELNTPDVKIITIEDPVEYELERICQVQVQSKIGLDFARVLRTILRQDPDVVLVGEMRDKETSSIAMRAALTGHLVLSTLHTNDAESTAIRLLDMGVPGFLVGATLRGVIAQRLMRRVCTSCKEEVSMTEKEKNWMHSLYGDTYADAKFYKGKGCANCNNIGYAGRVGIFEMLILTDEMIECLSLEDRNKFTELATAEMKGKTLLDVAIKAALDGETSLPEVLRVAGMWG